MPKLYLVPQSIPEKIHVFLNSHHQGLAQELLRQLETISNIGVVDSVSEADVIIYFAGFDPPSLTETLSHTTQLYSDLKSIKTNHTKFILVVKNPSSHLSRTAITLTNQYAQSYQLNHTIIEYDHSISLPELASAIIKKFVYHHSPTPILHEPTFHSQSLPHADTTPVISRPKKKSHLLRYLSILVLLISSPWLVSIILSLSIFATSLCLVKSPVCLHTAYYSSLMLQVTSRLSPGYPEVSTRFGLPMLQVNDTLKDYMSLNRVQNQLTVSSAKLLSSVFTSEPQPQISDLIASLNELDSLLNLVQADLRSIYLGTTVHHQVFENLAKTAGESRHSLNTYLSSISMLLQDFTTGKKTFAILLQDNWELRGSGGLVEVVTVIKTEDGHVDHIQTFSTKATDEQLVGSVAPPVDFQKLTRQTQWSLRDVSWDGDSQIVLDKAAWIIEKELGEKIDGVVLLDLNSLTKLLGVTGPVLVGESKINVNKSNFSQIYQTELGNSQKYNSFLTQLFTEFFEKIGSLDPSGYKKLLVHLASQVESNQILVTGLQPTSLSMPECRSFSVCSIDFSHAVSANITGSKTNLYLTKDHSIEVTLTPDGQTTRHTFNYLYNPPSNSWLSQNHQEYLRLYIPAEASNSVQVFLDGKQLPDNSLLKSAIPGLSIVGTSFTLNKNRPVRVEYSYQNPLPSDRQFHYQLDLPNQPGVIGDKVQVQINYPPAWAALVDKVASVAAAGLLEYNYAQPNKFQVNIDFTTP